MGLGGLTCGTRTADTVSLLAFVPALAPIRKTMNTDQLKVWSSLKSLVLVETVSQIIKSINKHFMSGIDIKHHDGTVDTVHPFVLTCITDGPGFIYKKRINKTSEHKQTNKKRKTIKKSKTETNNLKNLSNLTKNFIKFKHRRKLDRND